MKTYIVQDESRTLGTFSDLRAAVARVRATTVSGRVFRSYWFAVTLEEGDGEACECYGSLSEMRGDVNGDKSAARITRLERE